MQPNEQTPEQIPTTSTPATTWRRASQDGELYTLPGSGHVARLRRPGLTGMAIKAGNVPNPLSQAVLRFLAYSDDPLARPTEAQMIQSFEKNSRAYVEIAQLALVEPQLVLDRAPDYDAGEIGPADIADVDYAWIVGRLVEGRAAELAAFRIA